MGSQVTADQLRLLAQGKSTIPNVRYATPEEIEARKSGLGPNVRMATPEEIAARQARQPAQPELPWYSAITEPAKALALGTAKAAQQIGGAGVEMVGAGLANLNDLDRRFTAGMQNAPDAAQQVQQIAQTPTANPFEGQIEMSRRTYAPVVNAPSIQPDPQVANATYLGDAPMFTKGVKALSDAAGSAPSIGLATTAFMTGGPLAAGVTGGMLEAANKYDEAKQQGLSDNQAIAAASVTGVGTSVLNALPFAEKVIKFVPAPLRGRVSSFIMRGIAEAGTESAEGAINPFADIAAGRRKLETYDDMKSLLADAIEGWKKETSVIPGSFLGGGVMSLGINDNAQEGSPAVPPAAAAIQEAEQLLLEFRGNTPAQDATQPNIDTSGLEGLPDAIRRQVMDMSPQSTVTYKGKKYRGRNTQIVQEQAAQAARAERDIRAKYQPENQGDYVDTTATPVPPEQATTSPALTPQEAPPIPQPTPEQLALEQQILGADLVDSRDIPKPETPAAPKTAKEKMLALKEARKQSLIDTTVAQEAPTLPASPSQSAVEPQTQPEATQTAPETTKAVEAPVQQAEFLDWQERPRGKAPIALYNIPTPEGGKTTVTAETAKAQGFSVPEPTKPAPVAQTPKEKALEKRKKFDESVRARDIADDSAEYWIRTDKEFQKVEDDLYENSKSYQDLIKKGENSEADEPTELFEESPRLVIQEMVRRGLPVPDYVQSRYDTPQKPTTPATAKAQLEQRVAERNASQEPVYSPETQAIVKAYGGREQALAVLNRQRDSLRGNEKVSPQTLAAIEELTGGKKTGQADLFGQGEMQPAPKADLPGQTRLPSSNVRVVGTPQKAEYADAQNLAMAAFRKEVRASGIRPTKGASKEEMGYKDQKVPWIKNSASRTADQWLERAYDLGIISDADRTEPSTIQKLMSGTNQRGPMLSPEGVEIPGVNQKAPDTGKPSSIGDIMKGMGLTEEAPASKSIGFRSMLDRKQIAGDKFVDSVVEQFGKTKEEAERVLAYYVKNKLVKLDPVDGQFKLKNGAFWEQDPIDRAVGLTKEKTTAPVPRKVTVNKLLSLVPSDVVSYDSKKNQISFDASDEGITKVREAMDKALDSIPQTPTAQAKYEEAYGEIMDAVFSKQEETAPKKAKSKGDNKGALSLDLFFSPIKALGKVATLQKWRHSRGFTGAGAGAKRLVIALEGQHSLATEQINNINRDFRRAAVQANGLKEAFAPIPEQQRIDLGKYLTEKDKAKKQTFLEKLPDQMREVAIEMRAYIDSIGRKARQLGIVTGELGDIIESKDGFYTRSTYKLFTEPSKWNKDTIPKAIKARAKEYVLDRFKTEWAGFSKEEQSALADQAVNQYMSLNEYPSNTTGIAGGTILGTADLSSIYRKGDIAKPIADLWGLEEDGVKIFSETAARASNMFANMEFTKNLMELGRGKFIWTKEDIANKNFGNLDDFARSVEITRPTRGKKQIVPIGELLDDGSKSIVATFGDAKILPEIKQALEMAVAPRGEAHQALKELAYANSLWKQLMTKWNPSGQARNVMTSHLNAVMTGDALYGTVADRLVRDGLALRIAQAGMPGIKDQAARDMRVDMIKRGILLEGGSREIRELQRESEGSYMKAAVDKMIETLVPERLRNVGKSTDELAQAAYIAGDDLVRAFSYLTQIEVGKDVFGLNEEQARSRAADEVRDRFPTYSENHRYIQALRFNPFFAPLTGYVAAMPRATWNNLAAIKESALHPGLKAKKYALQQTVGLALNLAGHAGVTALTGMLLGISKDDEEDLNRFNAPWDQVGSPLHRSLDRKTGQYEFVNQSYTDPTAVIKEPMRAYMNAPTAQEGLKAAMWEIIQPYVSQEVAFEALNEISNNQKKSGAPIFNDADPLFEKITKSAAHVAKEYIPPPVKDAMKARDSNTPFSDMASALAGVKKVKVSVPDQLGRHASAYQRLQSAGSSDVKNAMLSGDKEAFREQLRQHEDARRKAFDSMVEDYSAALRVMEGPGVKKALIAKMKEGGISEEGIARIVRNKYKAWEPSDDREKATFLKMKRSLK